MGEHLVFPVIRGITSFTYRLFYPGLRMLRPPNQPTPVQATSSGYSYWVGSITIGLLPEDDPAHRAVSAFINELDGGLRSFIIPFEGENYTPRERRLRSHLFDSKDESDDANSVQLLSHTPSTPLATRIGFGAELTLDTPASPGNGFKRGYFASLHNADKTQHYGLLQCRTDQVGDKVLVGPKPPPIPENATSYRMDTRTPTLPVKLTEDTPAISRDGWLYQPVVLPWIQAVSPYGGDV